jgi:DNA (cytosine-5)-methyltransferase 1
VSSSDAVDELVRLLLAQPAERGRAVDMFAGGGGWHEGARRLGLRSVGLELDDAACATSRAAGHPTVQCDVATIDWQMVARRVRVDGAIGSAPCPTWSSAGKGSGRDDMDLILSWVPRVAASEPLTELRTAVDDARSALVLEPLRMIVATRPTWIALEQVPSCLPIWQTIARALEGLGYRTWTGILEAERYGVPQTRERAILLARRDGCPCHPPAPTHQRYVPGEPRLAAPQLTLEGEVLPWVSMADALASVGAWDGDDAVGFPRRNDRDDDAGDYRERDLRSASEPAFAMSEKVRSWTRMRANAQPNAAERAVDEPAPTITGGHDTANHVWLDRRQGDAPPRSEDEPAHTMSSSGLAKGRDVWLRTGNFTAVARDADGKRSAAGSVPYERPADEPAPTMRGVPGHWGTTAAVRVTVEEAAALQSFPPGYPWSGSKSKQYQQIGNAVPPLLALHVLAALLDIDPTTAVAVEDAA